MDLFVRVSNSVAITMYNNLGYTVYRKVLQYYSGEKVCRNHFWIEKNNFLLSSFLNYQLPLKVLETTHYLADFCLGLLKCNNFYMYVHFFNKVTSYIQKYFPKADYVIFNYFLLNFIINLKTLYLTRYHCLVQFRLKLHYMLIQIQYLHKIY